MKLTDGTLLQGGKYKVEKVLGQGSFGITYLAEHTALGKKICIKEFFMKELNSRADDGSVTGLTDGSLSYNYAQKFRKEASNLARLDHPNIVKVADCFDEKGTFYYVMEHIDGENLNDYLKHSAVSQEKAVEIIKQVAEALIYMHEKRHMLHLDLKPGNIMRRASDGHIFLIDFGLSKHFDGNGAPETSTTIGLGTMGYAPIEQTNQAKNGEFRPTIDVYALGATLYKLLTRETPPPAPELVSDDELIAENFRKHNVSDSLVSVIIKAMQPSFRKRTQTVREFVNSLASVNTNTAVVENLENAEEETLITKVTEDETRKVNNSNSGTSSYSGISSTKKGKSNAAAEKSNKRSNSSIKRYGLFALPVIVIIAAVAIWYFCFSVTAESEYQHFANDYELNSDLDSLAFYFGYSQAEGLKQTYYQNLVDSTCVDSTKIDAIDMEPEFWYALIQAAGASKVGKMEIQSGGEGNTEQMQMFGLQMGQVISQRMVPGLNQEIFGADSTKTVSVEKLLAGLIQGTLKKTSVTTPEHAQSRVEELLKRFKMEANKDAIAEEKKFLQKIEGNPEWRKTSSGLLYRIIKQGHGRIPNMNSTVTVHYEGKNMKGEIFDSSYERKEPATFPVVQVIKGWQEAMCMMPVGSTWELCIPDDLAYGEQEQGEKIPAYSALTFKVDLLSCN